MWEAKAADLVEVGGNPAVLEARNDSISRNL